MFDFLFKIIPTAIRAYLFTKRHRQELLSEFVLDAIGLQECLNLDSHESGTVSLATIDTRMQTAQTNVEYLPLAT
jgi:hypothetical protein